MKVLFVSSGKENGAPSVIVKNQGESLKMAGIDVEYFTTCGKGIMGYLRSVPDLRRHVSRFKPDILHAHYYLSGYLASLITGIPKIISLMGSDLYHSRFSFGIIRFLSKWYWTRTVVKSEDMYNRLGHKAALIIPNGVNLARFNIMEKGEARAQIGVGINDNLVLFVSDPNRAEKNFNLAREAIESCNSNIQLRVLSGVSNTEIPQYLNAADLVLMTSNWEGSPNIIKESMACNCPIVSTDVGDVRLLFGDVDGTYITDHTVKQVSKGILQALEFSRSSGRTIGRERIKALGLDSITIAEKLSGLYRSTLMPGR